MAKNWGNNKGLNTNWKLAALTGWGGEHREHRWRGGRKYQDRGRYNKRNKIGDNSPKPRLSSYWLQVYYMPTATHQDKLAQNGKQNNTKQNKKKLSKLHLLIFLYKRRHIMKMIKPIKFPLTQQINKQGLWCWFAATSEVFLALQRGPIFSYIMEMCWKNGQCEWEREAWMSLLSG